VRLKRLLAIAFLILIILTSSITITSITMYGKPFYAINPTGILLCTYLVYSFPILIGIFILGYIIANWSRLVEFAKELFRTDWLELNEERERKGVQSIIVFIIIVILYFILIYLYQSNKEESLASINESVKQETYKLPVNYDIVASHALDYVIPATFIIYSIVIIVFTILIVYGYYSHKKEVNVVCSDVIIKMKRTVEKALKRIETGDPIRDIIIETYLQLTEILGKIGYKLSPEETPREYKARVSISSQLPKEPIEKLTMLFEEARYSHHELRESYAKEAIEAITNLGRYLGLEVKR